VKKFFKKLFLDLNYKLKTPHPSPLPASGERGFDGLGFCNKYKIEEEIRSIFFIPK
jgi:hypothetical protein